MKVFSTGWSYGVDGPGRRFVVYLKGCNLRCAWCANPESISAEPELLFYPERGRDAASACPFGAVVEGNGSVVNLDRSLCRNCTERPCVTVRHHPAFEWSGADMTVDAVVQMVLERKVFLANSGVTFGGGEPSLQADELCNVLDCLRAEGIDSAVESNASTEFFHRLPEKADLMICDLKTLSEEICERWTGANPELVKSNLRLAAEKSRRLWIRIPLVPGVNDSNEEKKILCDFLCSLSPVPERVEILRLHHLSESKWRACGREYPAQGIPEPDEKDALNFAELLKKAGINALTT